MSLQKKEVITMTILCRIKKWLNIKSPSPYEYCKLNLNAENKKRCLKCKHFKTSQYHAYVVGQKLTEGIKAATESMNNLVKGLNSFTISIEGGNENNGR